MMKLGKSLNLIVICFYVSVAGYIYFSHNKIVDTETHRADTFTYRISVKHSKIAEFGSATKSNKKKVNTFSVCLFFPPFCFVWFCFICRIKFGEVVLVLRQFRFDKLVA